MYNQSSSLTAPHQIIIELKLLHLRCSTVFTSSSSLRTGGPNETVEFSEKFQSGGLFQFKKSCSKLFEASALGERC